MGIESSLAAAGIIPLPDKTLLVRDANMVKDLHVKDDLILGSTLIVTGDVTVAGVLKDPFNQRYTLDFLLEALSNTASLDDIPIPADGAGFVSLVRVVLLTALTGSNATLTLTPSGTGALTQTVTVSVAAAGIAISQAFTGADANNVVALTDVLRVKVSGAGGSAARARVQVEITRDA